MAKARSYKLLCPIARALDRIGDRWTLLILRDLHAGPARFSDLQRGLTGIAANLLTERLSKLVEDGLATKAEADHGAMLYELTDLGRKTGSVIFELALFGSRFGLESEPVKPGNLRTVATTLGAAASRIDTTGLTVRAALVVDGETIDLQVLDGVPAVRYAHSPDPDVILTTSYQNLLALSEGDMPPQAFLQDHAELEIRTPGKDHDFMTLMTRVIALLNEQA